MVCYLYDEFSEKSSLTDKFPSLSLFEIFQGNKYKSESETGCRLREITQWVQAFVKEAREKSTMASCSRRFLTFVERDPAVDAVDLESRNMFCWDLLLQHAVRSLVLQTLIVSLCLDLDLVLAHLITLAQVGSELLHVTITWFGH